MFLIGLTNEPEPIHPAWLAPQIEFSGERQFRLVEDVPSEVSITSPGSKLALLCRHCPKLRILWARSPHATVDLFKALKQKRSQPNVEEAVAIGTGAAGGGSGRL